MSLRPAQVPVSSEHEAPCTCAAARRALSASGRGALSGSWPPPDDKKNGRWREPRVGATSIAPMVQGSARELIDSTAPRADRETVHTPRVPDAAIARIRWYQMRVHLKAASLHD